MLRIGRCVERLQAYQGIFAGSLIALQPSRKTLDRSQIVIARSKRSAAVFQCFDRRLHGRGGQVVNERRGAEFDNAGRLRECFFAMLVRVRSGHDRRLEFAEVVRDRASPFDGVAIGRGVDDPLFAKQHASFKFVRNLLGRVAIGATGRMPLALAVVVVVFDFVARGFDRNLRAVGVQRGALLSLRGAVRPDCEAFAGPFDDLGPRGDRA